MVFTLVGAHFRPTSAKAIITHLNVGDLVTLQADPDNEYDETAVAVHAMGEHIGFVPRGDNAELFARLMDGEKISAEVIAFENSLKPVLEVE